MPKFRKDERLCGKKLIDKLFTEGNSFIIKPFKINILTEKCRGCCSVQVLIIVSKKRFKNAVTRNLIKRKIREAYRLSKGALYEKLLDSELKIIFSLSYIGKEQIRFDVIENKIKTILNKLEDLIL